MKCPLKFPLDPVEASDLEGTMWDTGIPLECWGCIHKALQSPGVRHENFAQEFDGGKSEENILLWTAEGIRRLNKEAGRLAIQEVGIDSDGTNENGLLSRATVEFLCEKS